MPDDMLNQHEDWRREWRLVDESLKQRNLEILKRAESETDHLRAWLGYMGFAKEEEARLTLKLHYLRLEQVMDGNNG